MSETSPSHLRELPSTLDGKVVLPDDARFDDARRAFNLAVDERPSAVVYPESAHDVAAVVRWARESGQQVTAQTTGHNASPLGSLENTILLKTQRMRQISIDPAARTARVEAGVIWIEVLEAAAPHGLAPLSGSSPNVGVAGYVLGGGISFLGRKYGLSANHVRAIELVTADGRLVRADRAHEELGPVNDTIATIQMPALAHLHMDPDQPVPGVADGLLITEMPEAALDTFVHVAGVNTKLPLFSVEVRHLGGAFTRSDPRHGALSSIQARYLMRAVEMLPAPELEPATRAHVESLKAVFGPWTAREMNLNFAETQRDPQSFWPHETYDRLRRIKATADPGNIIRSNHPIPPAR
jgi:hypothetical protein